MDGGSTEGGGPDWSAALAVGACCGPVFAQAGLSDGSDSSDLQPHGILAVIVLGVGAAADG